MDAANIVFGPSASGWEVDRCIFAPSADRRKLDKTVMGTWEDQWVQVTDAPIAAQLGIVQAAVGSSSIRVHNCEYWINPFAAASLFVELQEENVAHEVKFNCSYPNAVEA